MSPIELVNWWEKVDIEKVKMDRNIFSFPFIANNGATGTIPRIIAGESLRSLSIYINEDALGPIFVSAYLQVDGDIHHLGQKAIFDAAGFNAGRFEWTGDKPLSKISNNVLNIQYANYCGDNVNIVQVTGVVYN